MPLRSRLAIMSALAVAIAIGAVALVSYVAVRDRLHEQMDKSIAGTGGPVGGQYWRDLRGDRAGAASPCGPQRPANPPNPPSNPNNEYHSPALVSITYYDGASTCALPGSTQVTGQPSDLQIAGQAPDTAGIWRDGVTKETGEKVRIEVVPAPTGSGVFLKSQPYQPIDDSLSSLAWLLFVVSLIGIGGAVTAGLLVARAALRPVDVLTEAVEHVARTEDLSVRMPVAGHDEIARLSESFNAMTAALQSSRDEQKRLVDDAGHELRTPLTSLRTTIDLLIRSEESGRPLPEGKRTELLTGARTQMRELTMLIADLLELSRPEQSSPVTAPVALHEVTARAVERVRPRGVARETPVTISEDLRPWTTHGDGAALERAVVNLLDNAVKFAPPGSNVEVRLANGALTVRDRGPGIAPEELPHVFERFWRSPTARAMPGSGLGLAIAARAARESGGAIMFERPHDGPGTVARLLLPGTAEA
ncbi:HAMP domain-containing histidine kinase [Catenulispora sp. NF23]|uniref:HAMP domain-containing sensor histidine kinase n=1 Tax=Catenulispora pinistramenti TaxID=2705254 RepID=UPI001BABB304|nr:HAMP domain-containing sensor histidine kinase [Catenulispora pinistramenti]MBS2532409.1 HAMP domain-containing histidine kinase [Catenulispora pinistramenti]